jgi:hypothetical protein
MAFSPRIASKATRALNAGEWLRLGFLMDFVPPVTLVPGLKSTYTCVRKTEATSECLAAAGTAPSGANQQPWHFAAIADPAVKQRIRIAAEEEERQFYQRRATDEWRTVPR